MKINMLFAGLAAGALLFGLASCQQATSSSSSTSLAGTASYYAGPIHATGISAVATVSTDADGNVTSAAVKEYMGPSDWVYSAVAPATTFNTGTVYTYTPVGGEFVRMAFPGHNAGVTGVLTDAVGYAFFVYNSVTGYWYEFTPKTTAALPTGTETAATIASNHWSSFDQILAKYAYAKAYADDCNAVIASQTSAALTTVSFTLSTGKPSATVVNTIAYTDASGAAATGANAATQIALRCAVAASTATATAFDTTTVVFDSTNANYFGKKEGGSLIKSDVSSAYFPMTVKSLGYRTNYARLIKFFTANPKANYKGAVQMTTYTSTATATTGTPTALSGTTLTADASAYKFPLPTSSDLLGTVTGANKEVKDDNGSATTGSVAVWTVTGAVDGLTGATYTDFPNYGMALQNAYLYAIGEGSSGDLRALVAR
jgi:hypothetical protein